MLKVHVTDAGHLFKGRVISNGIIKKKIIGKDEFLSEDIMIFVETSKFWTKSS